MILLQIASFVNSDLRVQTRIIKILEDGFQFPLANIFPLVQILVVKEPHASAHIPPANRR